MEEVEIKEFYENGVKIVIEMPKNKSDKDDNVIKDIKYIMNNETLLQLTR